MTADQAAAGSIDDEVVRRSLDALADAQKMRTFGLLVGGVAHELNNSLASIVAFSQLIRSDPTLPPDLQGQADLLIQEANRTRVIVQDLLDFARRRPPERVRTDLRALLISVLGLQSHLLAKDGVAVDLDIPDDLPALVVDRGRIQQALLDLTMNSAQAIAATERAGTIRIVARAVDRDADRDADAGPRVRISVSDDGPGVAPEVIGRLFEPSLTTNALDEGAGLGLSVAHGIVTDHGGTLRHEPNPAGGATFVVELPIVAPTPPARPAQPAPPAPPAEHPATQATSPATTSAHPFRILVLDDEPSVREFLARALGRFGYEPVVASSGAAALAIIASDPPAAIICDHRMAGMSGTEFHAAAGKLAPPLSRRFAFMSGDVLEPQLRAFAEERGILLLAKPFDLAAIEAVAEALVGKPS